MTTPNTTTAVATAPKPESAVEFTPFGSEHKIKLSVSIVKNLIAVPTKSGKTCSDRDAMKFLMLAQSKGLNPFSSEAYLIGFDTQDGPQFSMFVAHSALLMRAEADDNYDGMESGCVLSSIETGEWCEQEGDLFDDSKFTLVGGWARVSRKNRRLPTYRRVALKVFNKGRSIWNTNPAGQIVKVAEADALRSAYPTRCGSLYIREESAIEVESEIVPQRRGKLGNGVSLVETVAAASEPPKPSQDAPDEKQAVATAPDKEKAVAGPPESPQFRLEQAVTGAGFTWADFVQFANETGNPADADSLDGWRAVPRDVAARLVGKAGLPVMLKWLKEANNPETLL